MRSLEQARETAARTRAQAEALSAPRNPFETDMATVSGIRRKPNARADARRWARFDRESAAWALARAAQAEVERLERVEAYRVRNAPVEFTPEEMKAARAIRTRFGWQAVVRVNKTTVSVATGYSWVDRIKLSDCAGGTDMIGYYASVRDGNRSGLLLGPYPLKEAAEGMVEEARRRAATVNRDACWYAYGTARVTAPVLPMGRLGR